MTKKINGFEVYENKDILISSDTLTESKNDNKDIKSGFFSKLWNKTIFSDMIKKKRQDRQWRDSLREKARQEAQGDIERKIIEQYKQEEIDKMTKKKSGAWQKIADEFTGTAKGSDDKIKRILGKGNDKKSDDTEGEMFGDDKINKILGKEEKEDKKEKKNKKEKKEKHLYEDNERIKDMFKF